MRIPRKDTEGATGVLPLAAADTGRAGRGSGAHLYREAVLYLAAQNHFQFNPKPYSAAPASSPKCKFSGQTILMCTDIPQGTGGVGNLPEIGSSYFCLKLAFHLTFNYQAQNVFLAAGIRRMLSLLLQPDLKVVFMGRLGRVCACSCPKSGKEEQGEAWQVSLDPPK